VQSLRYHARARSPKIIAPLALVLGCGAAAGCAAPAGTAAQASPAAHASQTARVSPAAPARREAAGAAVQAGPAARPQAARPQAAASHAVVMGTTVPGAPNCPMFPPDNIWNTDISRLPVSSHSAAWMRSMQAATTFLHPDFGPNPGGYPYGMPFSVVTNSHRLGRLSFQYASESDKGPYPFGSRTLIEGGRKAGGDRHAIMVNKDTCTLYELDGAHYSAGRPRAVSGAIWRLESNALRPAGWTSADAAGLPILPGLLDYGQVRAAVRNGTAITHAIRFTAGQTRSAFIWPARHEASLSASRNLPPMGARFRLKASFRIARFCRSAKTAYCKDAKVVLTEMRHYGLIVADNGSNWFFQGSAFPQWPDGLVSLLKLIPARAFEAVSESCLMVRRNSGQATAKPGCPTG
jgi:hypothetical protein